MDEMAGSTLQKDLKQFKKTGPDEVKSVSSFQKEAKNLEKIVVSKQGKYLETAKRLQDELKRLSKSVKSDKQKKREKTKSR